MAGRIKLTLETTDIIETSRRATREPVLGHLAMLLFAALMAGSFSFGKLATPHIGPVALTSVRFMLATALMTFAVFGVLRLKPVNHGAPWRYAVMGLMLAWYFISMFLALTITQPVSTSAVFTLMPLMTAGFGLIILGQRIGPVALISLSLAAIGSLWMVFRADFNAFLNFEIGRGELIYFSGCIGHSIYAPLLRRWHRGEHGAWLSLCVLAATTVWITLAGLPQILETDWLNLPPIVWIVMAYLAIFSTAISFFLLQYGSLRLPASKVLAYGFLVPAFVILYEGLLGHGWAELPILIGALITMVALGVLYLADNRR